MSRICDLLGTGVVSGNNVSHSKRRTKTTWRPNLQKKKIFVQELNKSFTLNLSTRALKIIEKRGGLAAILRNESVEDLSDPLRKIKKQLA